jgi:hypothetical protein
MKHPSRGHHDKIAAAVGRLRDRGLLRANLRVCEREALVTMQLVADGWAGNMQPTRYSIRRYFERIAAEQQSHVSHNDIDSEPVHRPIHEKTG